MSDLESRVSDGKLEVSGSEQHNGTTFLWLKLARKHKKKRLVKKHCIASLPKDNEDDQNIEMVAVDDTILQVEEDPIKDIKDFFLELFVKEGQGYHHYWVCLWVLHSPYHSDGRMYH